MNIVPTVVDFYKINEWKKCKYILFNIYILLETSSSIQEKTNKLNKNKSKIKIKTVLQYKVLFIFFNILSMLAITCRGQ